MARFKRRIALAALAACLAATPAAAGPPYDTDDPVPTDLAHWEIYAFGQGARAGSTFEGATGFDLNYGALPGIQLTATLPLDFVRGPGGSIGLGDVELGVKYQFLRRERAGLSMAFFPRIILPTAVARGGTGKAGALLPVWVQQDMGRWSLFGGGGYAINPGVGNRNYWQAGLAATRRMSDRLSLGIEATHLTRDSIGGVATTTLGVGATWRLKGPVSLIGSAGPSFSGGRGDRYHAYVALLFNF